MTNCKECGQPAPVHFYCDEKVGEGPWCDACFEKQPCWTSHSEGCVTQVFEGKDD